MKATLEEQATDLSWGGGVRVWYKEHCWGGEASGSRIRREQVAGSIRLEWLLLDQSLAM